MASKHLHLPPFKLFTPGTSWVVALMSVAFIAAVYRFIQGLGSSTYLSDQYPWGIWVAFDVVCGVALAAGGFTTAAVVHVFWGEKYHSLLRPAILTGFLGYVFVAIGLIVDLGIPWHIWHPIVYWPKHSALFEVAWCVMLYTSVLALEFLPSVFEKFGWTWAQKLFQKLVPVFVVLALTWFTFIMSKSVIWSIATFVVIGILAFFVPKLVGSHGDVPVLLIIAGILFSTAHQSSLGTLFLLMPDKLHSLWWTPLLPVMFFVSAVAVGFAIVVFESTISEHVFKLPPEHEAQNTMMRIMMWVLVVYLLLRIVDVTWRQQWGEILTGNGILFLSEMLVGVVAPMFMVAFVKATRTNSWVRFIAACLMVFGLIFNRFNVTLFAMDRPGEGFYFPSPEELFISAGLISAIIFFYGIMVRFFPVLHGMNNGAPKVHAEAAMLEAAPDQEVD